MHSEREEEIILAYVDNLVIATAMSIRGGVPCKQLLASSCSNMGLYVAARVILAFFAVVASNAAAAEKALPNELNDPTMFCEGCYGSVSEIAQMMEESRGKEVKLQERIGAALGAVCHTDNLRKYVFSPPKMVKVRAVKF